MPLRLWEGIILRATWLAITFQEHWTSRSRRVTSRHRVTGKSSGHNDDFFYGYDPEQGKPWRCRPTDPSDKEFGELFVQEGSSDADAVQAKLRIIYEAMQVS